MISNFVYTTELNMILKQRTGLKHQETHRYWEYLPWQLVSKTNLVVGAYYKLNMEYVDKMQCSQQWGGGKGANFSLGCLNWNFTSNMREGHCFVFPGISEPSARTWMRSWVSPFKTDIQKWDKYGRENTEMSSTDLTSEGRLRKLDDFALGKKSWGKPQ